MQKEDNFYEDRDRYYYDFGECRHGTGWVQYDTTQDAWYFGIWVNPEKRQILTFMEGDESRDTYDTDEEYHAALAEMAKVYGNPPPAFVTIDMKGTMTKFYDKRPQ